MCVSVENYNPDELSNPCFVRNTIMWETKSIDIMKKSHKAQFKAYIYENSNKTGNNTSKRIQPRANCKTKINFEFLSQ